MRLICSKIERPSPVAHVARPRITSLLEASVVSGLATFVVGRAGTGKSVAAADLADAVRGRVAWYTVDASDSEFERFVAYLSSALGVRSRKIAEIRDAETAAERLLGELFELADALEVLVVEDLHVVYDAEWFAPFVARFLPMLPRHVHVLVTTRSLPSVPLWRMRSKQTLSVVDESELAFTDAEAVRLFARHGLSKESARAAIRTTRGRAAQLDATARELAALAPRLRKTG